ncbi:hypothetical protein BDK51DRAFT_29538 [Blyttiomyces helicus]|uniref:Uncharacterized protein n=1 Tax=Blyttiomyces helicus TaxID=388810 RepID=A0A4P9WNU5_9FUNG|nr:hypothetical protein BDK51DRAFT_29538 [Blyttiomyces helicus]|eukprot:RKO93965.1 hypothetical protein BDK51DRAFT_29538 [Blyttiomyces helicus]
MILGLRTRRRDKGPNAAFWRMKVWGETTENKNREKHESLSMNFCRGRLEVTEKVLPNKLSEGWAAGAVGGWDWDKKGGTKNGGESYKVGGRAEGRKTKGPADDSDDRGPHTFGSCSDWGKESNKMSIGADGAVSRGDGRGEGKQLEGVMALGLHNWVPLGWPPVKRAVGKNLQTWEQAGGGIRRSHRGLRGWSGC